MGRYDKEIIYDEVDAQGNTRKAMTIRVIDRSYNKNESIVHIVKDKETLFSIATLYYDDFTKWTLIADKNVGVVNPFDLKIGMQLIVPNIDADGGDI